MLKTVCGLILGAAIFFITQHVFLSIAILATIGVLCQVKYAIGLNASLSGADPVVTFGARSLGELKAIIAIPVSIQFFEFLAKSCVWGMIAIAILGFQSRDTLSPSEEANLENFARAFQEKSVVARAMSYPEAVAELEEMNKAIAAAFASNDVDAAHDPLHEAGHVLDELPELAKRQQLNDKAVAAIIAAVETLFNAFGKVDEKFHGGKGATYDEVKADVDSSMNVLRQYLAN